MGGLQPKANLGMILEQQIFLACDWYASRGIALIQKIPTPWQPERQNGKIVGAHVSRKSTVDFIGNISPNGMSIALEAKEEQSNEIYKSRVGLHQLKFLQTFVQCGGLAFVVVGFYARNRYFLIPADIWANWIKSTFSVDDCQANGTEVFLWDQDRRLDFLNVNKAM